MSHTPYPVLESRVLRAMAKMDNVAPFLRGDALWCRFFRWAVQKGFIVMPKPDTRPTYKIKRLEWVPNCQQWEANTIFGSLFVNQEEDGSVFFSYCVDEYYDEGRESCESIEEGKAKAEAWYLSRLVPALDLDDGKREGLEEVK